MEGGKKPSQDLKFCSSYHTFFEQDPQSFGASPRLSMTVTILLVLNEHIFQDKPLEMMYINRCINDLYTYKKED